MNSFRGLEWQREDDTATENLWEFQLNAYEYNEQKFVCELESYKQNSFYPTADEASIKHLILIRVSTKPNRNKHVVLVHGK